MSTAIDTVMRFGRFEIDPVGRVLRVDGEKAAVGARAFDLLLALAQRRGRLVSKQELLDLVWPGVVVEEHNIAAQMSTLRKLLGPDVIATVAGRGYRFVATPSAGSDVPTHARPQRHNLPEARTRFIGREAALADLARLVPPSRLTTLIGIGGSGKTRLALQLARSLTGAFAGGIWFVDLAPLQSADRVASACAATLGLSDAHGSELVERIAAHLTGRDALLLLDNCEHVRAGAAAVADALLARAGGGGIIATSREALGVAGEQLYPVRAMALPVTSEPSDVGNSDAVRLFVDRARLAVPEFELDADNAATVARICRRLDGIALAIELAAARVALLPVTEISARLADRFQLLGTSTASDPRQRTLLATMQWSYDQLPSAAQRLLRRMSAFAGGWTLAAAADVAECSDEYEALTLLTALHDHSLVVVERGDRPRYRMLETVRQYALQRLDESGDGDRARIRQAEHFLRLAESAAPHLRGLQQPQWMAQLRVEQENLVAAMSWCATADTPVDPRWALRFVAATGRYWIFNAIDVGCGLAQSALQRDREAADSAARFETLHALAAMHMHRGDAGVDLEYARMALAMAQRCNEIEWQIKALAAIGSALNTQGDVEGALRDQRKALQLAEASGNVVYVATLSNNLAETERGRGDLESAERSYLRALHLGRASGDLLLAAIVLHNLVRLYVAAQRPDDARRYALESEQLLRGIGEVVLKFELLKCGAALASSRGHHAMAVRWFSAAQPHFTDAGYGDPQVDSDLYRDLMETSARALGAAALAAAEAEACGLELDTAMRELKDWLDAW
jgi:predicted ATPase/DNA-binding winged helix-turn-helix (wHTH) protein